MGYFTYRVYRDLDINALQRRIDNHLSLYAAEGPAGMNTASIVQGNGCAAILFSDNIDEQLFRPIGHQIGGIWMDVRYQNGDSWDLSVLNGFEQVANHKVNPWAYDDNAEYDQKGIDYRIEKICSSWPKQGKRLKPYLLTWKFPNTVLGISRLIDREGKASPEDHFNYGDAHQIYDFLAHFGFNDNSARLDVIHPKLRKRA